ncbi:NAD-dependent epimerase/dehydratase family protein [bacterium]|nr:NAD-dependent epimerase/dehydratase family protein [bacterium]
MAKILVTGGAGFIGSWVAQKYMENFHEVVVLDDLSMGFKSNLPEGAKFYQIDIRSAALDKLFEMERFDYVNHHAAQISVRKSVDDPAHDADINLIGTLNLLKSSVKWGVKKFIFASTGGAIYGEQQTFPAGEEHPANPLCPYGIHKLTVEKYLYYFRYNFGLNYVILRYANVYGPRQNPFGEAGVVAIFAKKMLRNEPVTINGEGKQSRDFVYVGEVARANLLALEYPQSDFFNIGTGKETDINTIYEHLSLYCNYHQAARYGPPLEGEQLRSSISFAKARDNLGWSPEIGIETGLDYTAQYFKALHKS